MPAAAMSQSRARWSLFGRNVFQFRRSGFFRISDFGFRISVLSLLFFASPAARACTVCFGNSDSKLMQGMMAGVLVLLLFVLAVLGGFVALFVYFARRAAALEALENQSTVTDSTVNS